MNAIEEATSRLYDYADAIHNLPHNANIPHTRKISFGTALKLSPGRERAGFQLRSPPRRRGRQPPVSPAASGKMRISPKRKVTLRRGSTSLLGTFIQPLKLAKRKRGVKKMKDSLAFWKSHSTSDVCPEEALEPLNASNRDAHMTSGDYDEDEYDADAADNGPSQYLIAPSTPRYGVENPFLTPVQRTASLHSLTTRSESPPLSPATNSPSSMRSSVKRCKSKAKAIQLLGVEATSFVRGTAELN